jgi:hypothetical protein
VQATVAIHLCGSTPRMRSRYVLRTASVLRSSLTENNNDPINSIFILCIYIVFRLRLVHDITIKYMLQ